MAKSELGKAALDGKNKIVIIGTGMVGMSFAYALLNQKTGTDELVLIDIDKERAEGEALDLRSGMGFSPGNMRITSGDYKDCEDADIVVITAGAKQAEGETRMDLLKKNTAIFKGIVGSVMESGFDGIFLVVSNPVDVMTQLTQKYSGLPHSRVIGSGTTLDSSRLMKKVGKRLGVDPKSVHGYVVGEHGDSGFIVWSKVDVGLESVRSQLSDKDMEDVGNEVRNGAYEIINRKGATYYGIGMCLCSIVEAIFNNSGSVMSISNWDNVSKTYFGWPAVLRREGVARRIGVDVTAPEQRQLEKSIEAIKEAFSEAEHM
jgi:L-lactate dehydrogenase